MKSYLSLIPISAKARRKQNRLTLACIILAVFLVTAVFSMAEIITKGEEASTLRRHGNYHIILSGISEEEAAGIKEREDVAAAAWYRVWGDDAEQGFYTMNGRRIVLYGAEPSYMYDIRNYALEGAYPQNDSEMMLSVDAKEQYGLKVGDSAVVSTPAGQFSYTVSGFCADDADYNRDMDGVCGYTTVNALTGMCDANGQEGAPVCYVQFAKKTNFRKAINSLKEAYGLGDGNIKENTMVLGLAGASGNKNINAFYITAAAVFLLILVAGILMISSCMNSNVAQRTRFFGMLRCIGASKKQVVRFVRLEALNWCKTAVPIGCGLGILASLILNVSLKKLVGGEWNDYTFRFSILGIVSGALVGVVTVLLAAHSPAKRAASVSPMAAVSGNIDNGRKASHGANTSIFTVEKAIGVHHAVSAKKNLILMSLSFAFSVILFLVFSAGLEFVHRLLPSAGRFSPDISIVSFDNGNSLDRGLAGEIEKLPGVKAVFGDSFAYDTPALINGTPRNIDLISYDEYMFEMSKKSVVSGDLSKITDDGNYALTIFNRDSRLSTGDKIQVGDTELEIACVVSEGIGNGNRPVVIVPNGTFKRLTGEDRYGLLSVQLDKKVDEATVEAIRSLAGINEFADRREDENTSYSSFWVFRLAAYGFLAIIALITVFNIINNISMSVSARLKQYGAMRAVGMSVSQLTKMISAEAATYAACGLAVGYGVGLFLHRLMFVRLITTYFGGNWSFPWQPIAVITLIVLLSCVMAVHMPAKRIREMAVTEVINEF